MRIAIPLVLPILTYTFTFASCSDTIEDRIIDFLKLTNQSGIQIPNVIHSVTTTQPSNDAVDTAAAIAEFIAGFAKTAAQYIGSVFKFTLQYQLFTPANPIEGYYLELSEESLKNTTFDPSLDSKFIIHGYSTFLPTNSVYYDLKDLILNQGDYNVIVVNWTNYNGFPYTFASINAPFVGFEIGKLIEFLTETANITSKSVHLIGHSLGAQVAAFTGKVLKNIGRITGLDSAGPIFQGLPMNLRLNKEDADFVDAIHTNGALYPTTGFGTLDQYAHMDFFPNGGIKQPNCDIGDYITDTDNYTYPIKDFVQQISCSHNRALFLFFNSISICPFESVPCSSYGDFENGDCPPEVSVVARMGFHAEHVVSESNYTAYYLDTGLKPPYC